MKKYSFCNDYAEGGHPAILKRLSETNDTQEAGYGYDSYYEQARALMKQVVGRDDSKAYFLCGGTQTNLIALSSLLKPYESIIAPITGHICVLESGSVEATGHKVHTVEPINGKIAPQQIEDVVKLNSTIHHSIPRVVYISESTGAGTVYSKKELHNISSVCKKYSLYLYIDGARIGHAVMAEGSDASIADIAQYADVFYIGGTKNGALLGEAVIFTDLPLCADFRWHMKQRGGLLAKSRILAVQFLTLFTDDLYFQLADHANTMAQKLASGLKALGIAMMVDSPTNQIFPILPHSMIDALQSNYDFYRWQKIDNNQSAIRLVTSWATKEEMVEEFLRDVKGMYREIFVKKD